MAVILLAKPGILWFAREGRETMCELFGMSSRLPATVNLSMEEFARHGGLTGPHADGWGMAFFEGAAIRLLKEPEPAADSPWIAFVREQGIKSPLVISHVRRATRGPRSLANTQPFGREMGGRMHVFAHNGFLDGVDDLELGAFRPVGETDSELAFCHLLARLQPLWMDGAPPEPTDILPIVADVAKRLAAMGPANFLYADGQTLYVHSDRRTGPDGVIVPPGLHILMRECPAEADVVHGPGVRIDAGKQSVVLVASRPLSEEPWQPLAEGTVLALSEGTAIGSAQRPGAECSLLPTGLFAKSDADLPRA